MLDAAARAAEGDFNPLPSCEGRREKIKADTWYKLISIHSPHARGDSINL